MTTALIPNETIFNHLCQFLNDRYDVVLNFLGSNQFVEDEPYNPNNPNPYMRELDRVLNDDWIKMFYFKSTIVYFINIAENYEHDNIPKGNILKHLNSCLGDRLSFMILKGDHVELDHLKKALVEDDHPTNRNSLPNHKYSLEKEGIVLNVPPVGMYLLFSLLKTILLPVTLCLPIPDPKKKQKNKVTFRSFATYHSICDNLEEKSIYNASVRLMTRELTNKELDHAIKKGLS